MEKNPQQEPPEHYLDLVRNFALSCQGKKKPFYQKLQERKQQEKLRKQFSPDLSAEKK